MSMQKIFDSPLNNIESEIALQKFLFYQTPSRLQLFKHKSLAQKSLKIGIYRNHSFELIENTIAPYLNYANIAADFIYSDYDDSLSFDNIDEESDILIIWVDFSRYNQIDLKSFLSDRLNYLKTIFDKPILLINIGADVDLPELTGIYNVSIKHVESLLGEKFYDKRMAHITGTTLSCNACLELSKELGLKYIPSVVLPNIKAVVVDLDNTLYSGVLGEDGIENIIITDGHKILQKYLQELSLKGFFICIASKNNIEDVQELFKKRTDFEINFSSITKIYASWGEKVLAIEEIAKSLNIHADSILFIDDNVGEIISVKSQFPEIKFILASEDANITKSILENYPGVYKYYNSDVDLIRHNDVKRNEQREIAKNHLSKEEYIKSLDVELTYRINNLNDVKRISELANKTNQFIFNYKRYSQTQIEKFMMDRNCLVISISLKDRLSDSGLIGAIIVKNEQEYCLIEDLFISCRALGRGINDIMILHGIKIALEKLNMKFLKLLFTRGERNQPAFEFIEQYLKLYVDKQNPFEYNFYGNYLKINMES